MAAIRSYAEFYGQVGFLNRYRPPTATRAKPHPIPEGMAAIFAMVRLAKEPHHKALVALCGLCGLRVDEAVTIEARHVSLEKMCIIVPGKGGKTRRVPLTWEAFNAINLAYAIAMRDGETLVKLSNSGARKRITALGKAAGLKNGVASHDLRSTLATASYDASKDLRAVQEILGHSDPKTTQGYVESTFDSMRSAIQHHADEVA